MISTLPKWAGGILESLVGQRAEVIGTTYLSPHLKKVRFQSDLAKMNFQIGYASVIRVNEIEYRNYTIAYHDMQLGILDIIFHIHNNGPGSSYADALSVGDHLYISSPRGHKVYNPKFQHQLLFGDETSLGLACSLLPTLKKNNHSFQFYLELDDANREVPELLGLENCSIFPKNGSFSDAEWVDGLPIFHHENWLHASYTLVGNVTSVQAFRKALKRNGVNRITTQGYWLQGKKGL